MVPSEDDDKAPDMSEQQARPPLPPTLPPPPWLTDEQKATWQPAAPAGPAPAVRPGRISGSIPRPTDQHLATPRVEGDGVVEQYWRDQWPVIQRYDTATYRDEVYLVTGRDSGALAVEFDAFATEEVEKTVVVDQPDRGTSVALFLHPGGTFTRRKINGMTVLGDGTQVLLPPSGGRTWWDWPVLSATLPPYVANAAEGRDPAPMEFVPTDEVEEVTSDLRGLATTSGITLLVGHREAGKSMVASALAIEARNEKTVRHSSYGHWVSRSVLYLDTESKSRDIKRRWQAMGGEGVQVPNLVDLSQREDLSEPGGRMALRESLGRANVVVVDSLPGLLRLCDIYEGSTPQVSRFISQVLVPVAARGATVPLTDLPLKDDREAKDPRGGGKAEHVDVIWSVSTLSPFEPGQSGLIGLTRRRDRYGVTEQRRVTLAVDAVEGLAVREVGQLVEELRRDALSGWVLDLVEAHPWELTWSQVEEQHRAGGPGSRSLLRQRHHELVEAGLLAEEVRDRRELRGSQTSVSRLLLGPGDVER